MSSSSCGWLRLHSVIYQGESETLDHSMVTHSCYDHLVHAKALHINAGYPLSVSDDISARRTSGHNPVSILFSFD